MDTSSFYEMVRNIVTSMGTLSGIFLVGHVRYMITSGFSRHSVISTVMLLVLGVVLAIFVGSKWYKGLEAEAMVHGAEEKNNKHKG